ncbi:hypothetical protein [Oryzomonas rubra]|uniref:Uncharacterized protein n=1 Tax=Oryzomonas rubra TaxID=2509454 RepID=A0A5A9X8L4_9BACT|nr:hypothetical protein [Oryzomonas rubra]KAA0888735.1 hypothetical protein ET418_15255 [Oryzomonas rubra]
MSNNEELKERARVDIKILDSIGRENMASHIRDLLAALNAAELDAECNRIQAVDRGNSFSAMQTENATLKTGCQSFQDSFYRESKKTKQLQQNNATLEAENAALKTRLASRTYYHDNAAVEAEVKRLEGELLKSNEQANEMIKHLREMLAKTQGANECNYKGKLAAESELFRYRSGVEVEGHGCNYGHIGVLPADWAKLVQFDGQHVRILVMADSKPQEVQG